ncbi:hypothetical protein MBRA1_003892 [Malassezia brasiliensis]|uniref:Protein YAE1 n=1 Tax=Malassezia brasiliensis TaxID=1821822 RepID=A0AAF0DYF0_9BASI|nr:hypothetical protein MBRA1_003892 [Malassezia brasiliensis]
MAPSDAGDAGDADDDWLVSDEDEAPQRGAEMEQRDRKKMEAQFHNLGYRQGLEDGKLQHLQAGFDVGYNTVGAPLGRAVGELRGAADSLLHAATRPRPHARTAAGADAPDAPDTAAALTELRGLCAELARVRLDQVAEPDWETVEHEIAHHSARDLAAELAQRRAAWAAQAGRLAAFQARLAELERVFLP